MSTITLPNIRVGSDLQVRVRLKDGGVAIDWSTLSNIKACIYSDAQRALAGRCAFSIDEEDSTLLVCTYAANKPQYLGVNRIVISAKYMGETKTYDKPAFSFVRWTADQEGEEITIDDPDVDVEIDVEDISSSILQEAVDAAFTAADRANDAAAAAEHMVDIHTGPEGKSAYEVAVEEGYTGTEEEWLASLKGDTGETPDISIGTVTTVEPGTPASASMTGTPEEPVLNLSIPQGVVGATPNFTVGTVTTGEPGSSVIVTITGTPEAPVLNLTIPQGMQGNTGSSVEYPYELVNNLTTNDATKGLTAAMGVQLESEVSQLEAKVNENKEKDKELAEYVLGGDAIEMIPGDAFVGCGGSINLSTKKWAAINSGATYYIAPYRGRKIKLYRNDNGNSIYYSFLTSGIDVGADAEFAEGYDGVESSSADIVLTIPKNAVYLYLHLASGGTLYTPKKVEITRNEPFIVESKKLVPCNGSIRHSDSKWVQYNGVFGCLIPVSDYRGKYVSIIKNPNGNALYYAFLTNGVSVGNTANFADGYSEVISANNNVDTIVPSDAVYLYCLMRSSVYYAPEKVIFYGPMDKVIYYGDSLPGCGGIINNSNKWVYYASYYSATIPFAKYRGKTINIQKNENGNAIYYSFLKEGFELNANAVFATGYSAVVSSNANVSVTVPNDAEYLYVLIMSGGTVYVPEKIVVNGVESFAGGLTGLVRNNEREKHFIDVYSYNIGHFSKGVSPNSAIVASNYEENADGFRNILSQNNPKIYGIVEYSAIFGKDTNNEDVEAKDVLFNYQDISFISSQLHYACYALFGNNLPIYNIKINDFECLANETITHTTLVEAQDYRYISADIYYYGKRIRLVVTHLAFDNNRPGVLTSAQISELITKYSGDEYVIMMGDWNVADFSEFEAFVSAGYTLANNGEYFTYPGGSRPIDNICVKGLLIDDVSVCYSELSDHIPLMARIVVPSE